MSRRIQNSITVSYIGFERRAQVSITLTKREHSVGCPLAFSFGRREVLNGRVCINDHIERSGDNTPWSVESASSV